MNTPNLTGNDFSHRLAATLVSIALLLTACGNLPLLMTSKPQTVHVSVTELSQYWIVKDGVLDWSVLFQNQASTGYFTADFVINSQGEIQLMDLTQVSDSLKIDALKFDSFSRQRFIATKGNYSNQPVSVTARIVLD